MVLVVILTVRRSEQSSFREFEKCAAEIMATHGGRIERVVELDSPQYQDTFKEVHLVRFRDADAFAAYHDDERLLSLAPMRALAIVSTEVFVGKDGTNYSGLSRD